MGMGEATVWLFAEAGARVVNADRDQERGRATTEQMRADGLEVAFVRAEVSDSASVEAMVAFAVDTYGRLDCAVNNAAVTPDTHPVAELDETEFDRVIAVNLKGVALCLKHEIRQPWRRATAASSLTSRRSAASGRRRTRLRTSPPSTASSA